MPIHYYTKHLRGFFPRFYSVQNICVGFPHAFALNSAKMVTKAEIGRKI